MKKLFMLILVVMAIGFISCEKPKPEEPKDYREKWVGSYECEEIYSWWKLIGIPGGGFTDTSGTTVYQTIVEVTAIGDSALNITERNYNIEVNIEGKFNKIFNGKGHIGGCFIGDSLYMVITPNYGNAYSATSEYKGKKIKNK